VCLIVTFSLQKHAIPALSSSLKTTQRTINFVQDIQPIFNASCVRCHGSSAQMAQLRLDSRNLALRGGISGRAIIPGKSGESLLVQRIQGLGDKVRMPLEGDPLSGDQIAMIRAWIDQGAVWPEQASVSEAEIDKHWAYVRPVRPSPPSQGHAHGSWVRNPMF
jgi:mono/diheme cytochrome c family protein